MALILNIETSSEICSVNLAKDGNEVITIEEYEDKIHASAITLLIFRLFEKSGLDIKNLDAVAVSSGPGSFTGLRIGLSTAKGICYALDIPIISIVTLKSMAYGILKNVSIDYNSNILICPMIDARKKEIYSALYDTNLNEIIKPDAYIFDENFLNEYNNFKIICAGSGTKKINQLNTNPNFIVLKDFLPSAKYMIKISFEKFIKQDFENLAYFEPFYIKNFIPSVPKKKII